MNFKQILNKLKEKSLFFGTEIKIVSNPKEFFSDSESLENLVQMVRKSFGSEMKKEDIYTHAVSSERLYLLMGNLSLKILAMAAYTPKVLSGIPSLIVEGIAVSPEIQGRGVFRKMTDMATRGEQIIGLRTQSPRMYRALEKYCFDIYPNSSETPKAISEIRHELADYMNCNVNDKGLIKNCYGYSLYEKEPSHPKTSGFFKGSLEMELDKGDAVLVVGTRKLGNTKPISSAAPIGRLREEYNKVMFLGW